MRSCTCTIPVHRSVIDMTTSVQAFQRALFEEHIESIAFLHAQRETRMRDAETGWTRLVDIEDRIDAHVDALVLGGALAMEQCRLRIAGDDPGEVYAAARVACESADGGLVAEIVRGVDLADPAKARALGAALRQSLPDAWQLHAMRAVIDGAPRSRLLLGEVVASRGLECADALLSLVRDGLPISPRIARALADTGDTRCVDALRAVAGMPSGAALGAELYVARLRAGDDAVRSEVSSLGPASPVYQEVAWAFGGRGEVGALVDVFLSGEGTPAIARSLGMLGDLAAVRPLVSALKAAELAPAAAGALTLITGAALSRPAFVADPPNPDEWFEEERQAFEASGKVPTHPDGRPFGRNVVGPSLDAGEWNAWLSANTARFRAGLRYRHGRPCSPSALVAALAADSCDKVLRARMADELVIRYAAPAVLDTEACVREQRRALAALEQWARDADRGVTPGRWHLRGRPS